MPIIACLLIQGLGFRDYSALVLVLSLASLFHGSSAVRECRANDNIAAWCAACDSRILRVQLKP